MVRDSNSVWSERLFTLSNILTGSGDHLPYNEERILFHGVKRPGLDTDKSRKPGAEVNNCTTHAFPTQIGPALILCPVDRTRYRIRNRKIRVSCGGNIRRIMEGLKNITKLDVAVLRPGAWNWDMDSAKKGLNEEKGLIKRGS